jgi:hypothetical protein
MSQDALLGESNVRSSNTVTKHIVDTGVMMNKKICELISRIGTEIQRSYPDYILNVIGQK